MSDLLQKLEAINVRFIEVGKQNLISKGQFLINNKTLFRENFALVITLMKTYLNSEEKYLQSK